jgi:hypothetical protein
MTVDRRISLEIVRKELLDCQPDIERWDWKVSPINEGKQTFRVEMTSPANKESFILEILFDNYREWPLFIEFIDPQTGASGVPSAYPAPSKKGGGFFHSKPCICHPCSRKAYKGYTDLHQDWGDLIGWQSNPGIGELKNIRAILRAIYFRVRDPEIYNGRMHA